MPFIRPGRDISPAVVVGGGGPAPEWIVPPSIEQGSRTTGATLTVNNGVTSGTVTSRTYQWYRDGVSIGGATSPTYVLTASDEAKKIHCLVTPYNGVTAGTAVPTRKTEGRDGSKTTVTMDWIEDVATDAQTSGGSDTLPAMDWGGHQSKVVLCDDGSVRVLYSRTVSTVKYARLMKRTGVATWAQEGEVGSTYDNFLLRDPFTDAPYIVAWDASPKIYVGPSFTSPLTMTGSWNTQEHGSAGVGPDGTVVVTEWDHAGNASTANNHERWNTARLYAGSWTQGGFVDINLATLPITPSGERFCYHHIQPYSSSGIGAGSSDRLAVGFVRDVNPGSGYEFDARRLWHIKLSDGAGAATREVVNIPGVDFGGHDDMIVDHLGRVLTVYRRADDSNFYLQVHNLDSSITVRMAETELSNFTDTYGRVKLAQDSRGRFWAVWLGGGGTTGFKVMQLTLNGTEPNGTLTLTQGSVTNLASSWSSYSTSSSAFRVETLRAGSPIDNKLYGYVLRSSNATITAFSIHLPD